ncbi:hypothetical protein [Thermotoga sp. KOL6]|uniref:hypothetical protein n=1 Tax=Thermotoga sp. KOL6 TaxID=126741 RepID=UPI000C77FE5E|nr:hypothetical protein [Thermotoga sp. KOL6]PLV59522.1 hypothetical protein AS005_06280 [Thermotoga sp. KOL6]
MVLFFLFFSVFIFAGENLSLELIFESGQFKWTGELEKSLWMDEGWRFNFEVGIGKGYGIVHTGIIDELKKIVEFYYFPKAYLSGKIGPLEMKAGILNEERGPGIDKLFLDDNSRFYGFPGVSLKYSRDNWYAESLWLGLNESKGFNYKTLVFDFGLLKIAYEDATVYVNEAFNPYYFFVPLPSLVIQEIWLHQSGAPWKDTTKNANSLIGGWIELNFGLGRVYFQALIDDMSLNRLLGKGGYLNPDKIALLGGFDINMKSVRLYSEVSGATAYTFERTSPTIPYEYTYFSEGAIEDRMIGYKYGENSFSFRFGVKFPLSFGTTGTFEYHYLAYGDRTPETPWHGSEMPSDTKWLIGNLTQDHTLSISVETFLGEYGGKIFTWWSSLRGFGVGATLNITM